MSARSVAANGLASAFLAGEWDPPAMTRRGQRAVGQRRVWVRDLALAARHEFPSAPVDRPRQLARFLAACPPFERAFTVARLSHEPTPRVHHWFVAPTAMAPDRPDWAVARLDTVGDLQDLLGLPTSPLLWYADPRGLERIVADERLRHYRYRWVPKRSGGLRLIEAPKPMLRHFQRVVLRSVLDHVPVHAAAHGFGRGRSALTFAAGHAGRPIVMRIDLADFFASVGAGRVFGLFRGCGYPEPVAHLLTALATNSAPRRELAPARGDWRLISHLAHAHLPQGAPTSPALANLAAFGLDRRLAGLASALGAEYSRYADDLAFSFPDHRSPAALARLVASVDRIAVDEGFRVNPAKTVVRRAGERQRLAGVVVNRYPNIDRREYDRLKAILHNCRRDGPAAHNRDGHPRFADHLRGRIAWVTHVNPARGERLLRLFESVAWSP